jgi:hypothetical protein
VPNIGPLEILIVLCIFVAPTALVVFAVLKIKRSNERDAQQWRPPPGGPGPPPG